MSVSSIHSDDVELIDYVLLWIDETDIQPTLMYLTGLHDDYVPDGRVISEVLATPNPAITAPAVETLGQCYKQLNSSVGQFGTATLMASTRALESTSPMTAPTASPERLSLLDHARDLVAGQIKQSLTNAEFHHTPVGAPHRPLFACRGVIAAANQLAK